MMSAGALRSDRLALDKALGALAVDLDGSGPLREERRTRILTQFANVDLSLPRPVDIAGRKAERERLILEQLLAEVSQIHPLIPQRLKDEGVSSLDRLARSNVEELSLRVSNSREQAEQI